MLESDLESDDKGTAEAGVASAQASGVPPTACGRRGLGVGFRGGARRNAPSRKRGAAGSARGALGTSLRDRNGVVNPVSLFFGENQSLSTRLRWLGEKAYHMPTYKTPSSPPR